MQPRGGGGAFTVTSPTTRLVLDDRQQANAVFTVANQSGHAARVRGLVVPETPTDPTWLRLIEPAERDLAQTATESFVVSVAVPEEAAAGRYAFRLDAVSVALPDEEWGRGPLVTFEMPERPQPKPKPEPDRRWLWIALVVIVVAAVGVGVAVYLSQIQPDLVASAFTIDPATPVRTGNVVATITVRNQGTGAATGNFVVRWSRDPSDAGMQATIGGLQPGEAATVTFASSYATSGDSESIAIIDADDAIAESDERNNRAKRVVSVQPRRANVIVSFTTIVIVDDADLFDSGEVWLDSTVNGHPVRWPVSGTRSVDTGTTYGIGQKIALSLAETEVLRISITGNEDDGALDDEMGTVEASFMPSAGWGQGTHSRRSTCPDGCFVIQFEIEFAWATP